MFNDNKNKKFKEGKDPADQGAAKSAGPIRETLLNQAAAEKEKQEAEKGNDNTRAGDDEGNKADPAADKTSPAEVQDNSQTQEPEKKTFVFECKKVNQRMFLEVAQEILKLAVSEEKRDHFVDHGIPADAFVEVKRKERK